MGGLEIGISCITVYPIHNRRPETHTHTRGVTCRIIVRVPNLVVVLVPGLRARCGCVSVLDVKSARESCISISISLDGGRLCLYAKWPRAPPLDLVEQTVLCCHLGFFHRCHPHSGKKGVNRFACCVPSGCASVGIWGMLGIRGCFRVPGPVLHFGVLDRR
jgi:hypothetical protein